MAEFNSFVSVIWYSAMSGVKVLETFGSVRSRRSTV